MSYRNKKFGEILNSLREKNGFTREELAEKIGVAPPTIGRYIKGRVPDNPILDKLVDLFDTPEHELLFGKELIEKAEQAKDGSVKEKAQTAYPGGLTPEEKWYVDRLLEALRGDRERDKELIKSTIDILTDKKQEGPRPLNYKEWVQAGMPERRRNNLLEPGMPKRRKAAQDC